MIRTDRNLSPLSGNAGPMGLSSWLFCPDASEPLDHRAWAKYSEAFLLIIRQILSRRWLLLDFEVLSQECLTVPQSYHPSTNFSPDVLYFFLENPEKGTLQSILPILLDLSFDDWSLFL